MTDYSEEITVTLSGLPPGFSERAAALFDRFSDKNRNPYHWESDFDDDMLSFVMWFWNGENEDYNAKGGKIDVSPFGKAFQDVFGKKFVRLPGYPDYASRPIRQVRIEAELVGATAPVFHGRMLSSGTVKTKEKGEKQVGNKWVPRTWRYDNEYIEFSDRPIECGDDCVMIQDGKRIDVTFRGGWTTHEKNAKDFWSRDEHTGWGEYPFKAQNKAELKKYAYVQGQGFRSMSPLNPGHVTIETEEYYGKTPIKPDNGYGILDVVAFAKADKKRKLTFEWETKGAYEDLVDNETIKVENGELKHFRDKLVRVEV
jgi:hypothetical protein